MIEITEATPERFQEFLEFVYGDKLETNVAGALDLLPLAHKYKIQPLTDKCEELLKNDLKLQHCVKIFEAAHRYGLQELKDRAGDTMVKNLDFLMGDSSLANAEEDTILYLLQRDDLNVREVKLFDFVYVWGAHQIAPSEDFQLFKERVKKLIPAIRFTNMTSEEITNDVAPKGLLSCEELDAVWKYIRAVENARRNGNFKFNTTPRRVEKTDDV